MFNKLNTKHSWKYSWVLHTVKKINRFETFHSKVTLAFFSLSSVNFSWTYLEKCCCILLFWLHYISMPFVSPSHTFGALLNFEIKVREVSLISLCCTVSERYVTYSLILHHSLFFNLLRSSFSESLRYTFLHLRHFQLVSYPDDF